MVGGAAVDVGMDVDVDAGMDVEVEIDVDVGSGSRVVRVLTGSLETEEEDVATVLLARVVVLDAAPAVPKGCWSPTAMYPYRPSSALPQESSG